MCYNLVTKCTICDTFIDSKVMKCLAHDLNLKIDGTWIRGCQATNTVDGWPLLNLEQLRPNVVSCPDGGRLQLHEVRVLDALCYTCSIKGTGFDDPKHEDYLGDRCGYVYQADFQKGVFHHIGSYLQLEAKQVTKDKRDTATYFVFFTNEQLRAWYSPGGRKRIDCGVQEYIHEDDFPYSASKLNKRYCSGKTQEQHATRERDGCPLTKLEGVAASWAGQFSVASQVQGEMTQAPEMIMAASRVPQPYGAPQSQRQTTQVQDMGMAVPPAQRSPVVPPPPAPMTAPHLQHPGDRQDLIPRQASQESLQSAPPNFRFDTSPRTSQQTTPLTPWLLPSPEGTPSPLVPVLAVAADRAAAERANADIAAAGGFEAFSAATYTEADAFGISMSPPDARARRGTRGDAIDLPASPVGNTAPVDANGIQGTAMPPEPLFLDQELLQSIDPTAEIDAFLPQQNAAGMTFDPVEFPDGANANGVLEGAGAMFTNHVNPADLSLDGQPAFMSDEEFEEFLNPQSYDDEGGLIDG